MKHAAVPTQPVTALFCAFFLAVALAFSGCSAGTLTGPDLTPAEETTVQKAPPSSTSNAPHNEGDDADKNGQHEGHN